MITVVRTRAELRAARESLGRDLGLVPTMGALHRGHAALIERAAAENRATAVSIFVNPAQFDDSADLARYPQAPDDDLALAERAGATLAFVPGVEDIYPPGFATSVEVARLSERWEGASRPGHFRGVATVVAVLLLLVRPARAYFGEKDYQQLAVLRRMHADLGLWGGIVSCPTVRDANGLALSSRNARLTPGERRQAPTAYAALREIDRACWAGEDDVAGLTEIGMTALAAAPDMTLDYLAIVDPDTLEPLALVPASGARILIAVRLGAVRLIDNLGLGSRVSSS